MPRTFRCGLATTHTLCSCADNAVLLPPDIAAPLSEQFHRLFQQYIATETLIEDSRGRLVPLIPHTTARHIPALLGLGDMDDASYLASIGFPNRFHRSAEVFAFSGHQKR